MLHPIRPPSTSRQSRSSEGSLTDVFFKPKLQERQKLAKKAEAMAAEIEAGLSALDFLFDSPSKELPRLLREYAQKLNRISGAWAREKGRSGRRAREQDDWVIEVIAEVYHRIGGRVAVSQTGPFARVLKVVWEDALPANNRSASAETFVRRAKILLPKLREMTKRLPRGGGWP